MTTIDSETKISVSGMHHTYGSQQFRELYNHSIHHPHAFWGKNGQIVLIG